jgi:hypothetical protein
MSEQQKLYRKLPEFIKSILITSEGWLVGSSIKALLDDKEVNDYDIIIPSRELFQIVNKQISSYDDGKLETTSFGGCRVVFDDGVRIDYWPEELDHFLRTANSIDYIYNMKRNLLLKLEK